MFKWESNDIYLRCWLFPLFALRFFFSSLSIGTASPRLLGRGGGPLPLDYVHRRLADREREVRVNYSLHSCPPLCSSGSGCVPAWLQCYVPLPCHFRLRDGNVFPLLLVPGHLITFFWWFLQPRPCLHA